MNSTDQAFIRAYGSDYIPSNADEAARAADYPALANSNVSAVFGSLPKKHFRVDGPATTPAAAQPQVASDRIPAPLPPRPYAPRATTPQPMPAAALAPVPTSPVETGSYRPAPTKPVHQLPDESMSTESPRIPRAVGTGASSLHPPIGDESTVSDEQLVSDEPLLSIDSPSGEPIAEQRISSAGQPSTDQAEQRAATKSHAPVASHAAVPRPHLNFAAVKVESQLVADEQESPLPVEQPSSSPAAVTHQALRAEDGLAVLADSSVLIGSTMFAWPVIESAVGEAPTVAKVEPPMAVAPPAPVADATPDESAITPAGPAPSPASAAPATDSIAAAAVATVAASAGPVADPAARENDVKANVATPVVDIATSGEAAENGKPNSAESRGEEEVEVGKLELNHPEIAEPQIAEPQLEESNIAEPEVAAADGSEHTAPLSSTITNVDQEAAGAAIEKNVDEPPIVREKLKPAWEVDRLLWPADADQLYESENEYFRHAGEKLRDASHEGLRVLGVSSSRGGEGCTTLAICLARAAAAAGAKVALLDANLRSPQLGAALGLDFARSWHESLDGKTPLAEAAVTAIADNVTLLPLSSHAARHGLTLDSDAVNDVLRQASEAFDLVLVDLDAPSDTGSHRFQSGEACPLDAAIIVRDVRVTSEEETLESVGRFRAMGIDAVGVAENFASAASSMAAA